MGRNLVSEPACEAHNRFDIQKLVAEMPEDYEVEEVDWEESAGKEEW